jgi:hypothetical protein
MTSTLTSGAVLAAGQSLISDNEIYMLMMAPNGILFIENLQTGVRLWSKGRIAQAKPVLGMQTNGDLVLTEGTPPQMAWDSNTSQFPGAHVTMCNNGNLVIYDSSGDTIWGSGTAQGSVVVASTALVEMRAALENVLAKHSLVEKALLASHPAGVPQGSPGPGEAGVNVRSFSANAE